MVTRRKLPVRDGISLEFIEAGDPKGMPLLLIHGIADSWNAFLLLLPFLDRNLRMIAPSLRGHGDSDKPESGYDSKEMADDMIGLMDRLMIDKAVVLGASSGGLVARDLVLRYPDRFVGMILLGSPLQLKDNPILRQVYDTMISKFGDEVDPDFIGEFVSGLSGTKVPSWFTGMMTEETMKVPSWVWKEYTASLLTEGIPDNLREIIVPCLIIWGGQDEITLRSDQEEASSLISDSRLVIHEDLGHMLYWEDPEAVAEDINGYIKEIAKAGV